MFISSMARKNKERHTRSKSVTHKRESLKSIRPLSPISTETRVFVKGSKEDLRFKENNYRSNTERTICMNRLRSNEEQHPPNSRVAPSRTTIIPNSDSSTDESFQEFVLNQEHIDPRTVTSHGLTNSLPATLSGNSTWYMDPIHRRTHQRSDFIESDPMPDVDEIRSNERILLENNTRALTGITPYELDLFRLRQEKLKLEEAYLLQQKCKLELERTRGPKPRWYELKTKDFTTEMEKYSNLMNSQDNWSELTVYRHRLLELSGDWANLKH